MSVNFFHQRLRQILTDRGASPDGSEVFFFNGQLVTNEVLINMNIGVKSTGTQVRGSTRQRLERYRLSLLLKNINPVVYVYNPHSKQEIAAALIARYGLPLEAVWFADGPISGPLPQTVSLDLVSTDFTTPDYPVNVSVQAADVDVADVFTNNVLSSPTLPWVRRLGYTNTEPLTYGVDFTPMFDDEFVLLRDTTDKLIPLINAKYGTDFEVADFETQPLVATNDPASTSVVTITPKADNVAYIGSFDVTYGIVEVALDSVVLVTTLTGFNYPNSDETKGQAAIYSYNLDGSTQPGNFWAGVQVGAVDDTFTVPFNQAYRVDEDWVYSTEPAEYNLFGATVEFVGTVADAVTAGFIANPVYASVVVLKLSETACTNFGGLLTVHFGGQAAQG